MTKKEFTEQLQGKLCGMPTADVADRIAFYTEMINDKIEDGLSQAEAVAQTGSVDEIAAQIVQRIPLVRIAKERLRPKKRLSAWVILLLTLGAPLWLPLLLGAIAVGFSLYACLWSLVACAFAVLGTAVGCAVGGAVYGVILLVSSNTLAGVALFGVGIFCAGLTVFSFFGSKMAIKGIVRLTGKTVGWSKRCFMKKEEGR